MKEKINVEVFVPATLKKYDFFIPLSLKVFEVAKLIAITVNKIENINISETNLMLCLADTKTILTDEESVHEAGIDDGSNLILL